MSQGGFTNKLKIQTVFYQFNKIMLNFGLDFVKHFILNKVIPFIRVVCS